MTDRGWVRTRCCLQEAWCGGSSLLLEGAIPPTADHITARWVLTGGKIPGSIYTFLRPDTLQLELQDQSQKSFSLFLGTLSSYKIPLAQGWSSTKESSHLNNASVEWWDLHREIHSKTQVSCQLRAKVDEKPIFCNQSANSYACGLWKRCPLHSPYWRKGSSRASISLPAILFLGSKNETFPTQSFCIKLWPVIPEGFMLSNTCEEDQVPTCCLCFFPQGPQRSAIISSGNSKASPLGAIWSLSMQGEPTPLNKTPYFGRLLLSLRDWRWRGWPQGC